jgi:hypothetical protein
VRVRFFPPEAGPRRPDETPGELSVRLLEEIRRHAPVAAAGRKPRAIEQPEAPVAAAAEAEAPAETPQA